MTSNSSLNGSVDSSSSTPDPAGSSPEETAQKIAEAKHLVDETSQITVLTGAGISTDSGIPDFRGPQGVWTKNPGAEKSSDIRYYVADPEIRKQNWQRLLEGSQKEKPEPNVGHFAVARIQERMKLHTLVTQNIDGLHLDSGILPENLVEVHGTRARTKCLEVDCGDEKSMEETLGRVRAGEEDPECEVCGGILKSATISFGQALVPDDIYRSEVSARECDLLLAIGSTLEVYPVAAIVPLAKTCGAKLIIINASPTVLDDLADVVIHASISEVLPEIVG